ncbi:hypothetical protein ACFL4T_04760 [candidate division KSB1 bacterium]
MSCRKINIYLLILLLFAACNKNANNPEDGNNDISEVYILHFTGTDKNTIPYYSNIWKMKLDFTGLCKIADAEEPLYHSITSLENGKMICFAGFIQDAVMLYLVDLNNNSADFLRFFPSNIYRFGWYKDLRLYISIL